MILTGKAKEDFLLWHNWNDNYFITTISLIAQYAVITEWLDTVGIYVNVVPIIYENKKGNQVRAFDSVVDHKVNGVWKTRQEATEDAIKSANEIYNQRHK